MADIATAPAATPPTPSAPPPPGGSTFNDAEAFGGLDALAGVAPPQSPAATPAQSKPANTPPVKPTGGDPLDPQASKLAEAKLDKTPVKPAVTPAPKPDDFNADKASPKQLREAYVKREQRVKELESQIAESKSKPAATEDPEKKMFQEKLTAAEKRLAELEGERKFINYEGTEEYQEKYQKPFEEAYIRGRNQVSKVTVTLPDGSTRKGTPADFDQIVKMAVNDYDAAAEAAAEMFGPVKAAVILNQLENALQLNDAKEKAKADYRTQGSEREKTRTAESAKFQTEVSGEVSNLWKEHVTGAMEKYSQWSKPVDGDEKGNALLEKGYALADKAFSDFNVMNPKLDKNQRAELVKAHAAVRNRAAWFGRLAHQHEQAKAQIKTLEAKLAEFEASVPKGGNGKRGEQPAADTMESAMDAAFGRR